MCRRSPTHFFGKSFPPASAWMMRARLLMLLLAGSMVLCRRCSGAVSLICMFCLKCGLYQHKSRNLFGEFKNQFLLLHPQTGCSSVRLEYSSGGVEWSLVQNPRSSRQNIKASVIQGLWMLFFSVYSFHVPHAFPPKVFQKRAFIFQATCQRFVV